MAGEIKLDYIYTGDCLRIMKELPDNCVDLIIADPPYDLKSINGGGIVNTIKGFSRSLKQLEDDNIIHGYDIELYGEEFIRISKDINAYFWCNKAQIPTYLDFYVNKHKCKFDILTWHKTNALPTYSNKYLTDTEYVLYFRKGSGKCFPETYDDAKTFYIAPINHKDKKKWGHPTIKPLDFTEKMIRNSSSEGGVVFDPFIGSGTTAVAAVRNDRHYIGCELLPDYVELANKRISEAIL